jgi:hypothetical protein
MSIGTDLLVCCACGCEKFCWPAAVLLTKKTKMTSDKMMHPICAFKIHEKRLKEAIKKADAAAETDNLGVSVDVKLVYMLHPEEMAEIRSQAAAFMECLGESLIVSLRPSPVEEVEEDDFEDIEKLSQQYAELENSQPTLTQMLGKPTIPSFIRPLLKHQTKSEF